MASSVMEQDTLSEYHSIIPEEGDQWDQLPNSDPFARLHGKFWGVNMQDEETKWRKTQPEEEPMSIAVDNQTPEVHEEEEEDIGPGSYILTLGIPSMGVSPLWIRQEYIRVYDYCEKYLIACIPEIMTPSVILTGQPGIGKSYWVYYAMRRYLAEKKPVIWYRDSRLFLFTKEGVFRAPSDFCHTTLKTRVRTLIDDHWATTSVPAHLAARENKYFIIFSTSPNQARWRNITKNKHFAVCVMNPWTKKEISKSAIIYGLAENDKRMYEMYDWFGPTPHICFNYILNPYAQYLHRANRSKALGSLSSVTLRQMVDDAELSTMDSISHTILLMKRMPKELRILSSRENYADIVAYLKPRVELVSPVVEREIRVRLWEQSPAEQLQLYRHLGNVESTRSIATLAFEAWAHSRLQRRINLVLVPMSKKESLESGQGKNLPQWHTNHRDGGNPLLMQSIHSTPLTTKVFEGSSLGQIEDGWYYIPKSKTQVAFDSFIMVKGNLYIFQCSLELVHQIKGGLLPFFSQKSLPPRANWHFVFVIPKDGSAEIMCPQPRDSGLKKLLDEMRLFTAALDVTGPAKGPAT